MSSKTSGKALLEVSDIVIRLDTGDIIPVAALEMLIAAAKHANSDEIYFGNSYAGGEFKLEVSG